MQALDPDAPVVPIAQRLQARAPDEALYALACTSYFAPTNPKSKSSYTNNKLTLAAGFRPPGDKPPSLDVLAVSVGTDSALTLKTRNGTGYYKVPSLKGTWYRGHYQHDGSVASLEEMFDPDRVRDTHLPGGFSLHFS